MQFTRLLKGAGVPGALAAQLAAFDHVASVRALAERGFDPVELGGDLALLFPDAFSPETVARLADLRDELGIGYTVHLPIWSVEPASRSEPIRRGSVAALAEVVRATAPLLPEVYTLHATGSLAADFAQRSLPAGAREALLRPFQAAARRSLAELVAETGLPSRMLAVETVQFPFDLTAELAEDLDLSLCVDTGHVLVGYAGPIDLDAALARSLPRLGDVHLHDAPRMDPGGTARRGEDHRPLGTGDLDVGRLLDTLEGGGYAGPLVFELTPEQALASMEVVRARRPESIAPPS
jgi:sugar phosphate isomerase/epimerase